MGSSGFLRFALFAFLKNEQGDEVEPGSSTTGDSTLDEP